MSLDKKGKPVAARRSLPVCSYLATETEAHFQVTVQYALQYAHNCVYP